MRINKIQRAAKLGMEIQRCNQWIAALIENDWWESYDGQTDDELVEAWTTQLCAWNELEQIAFVLTQNSKLCNSCKHRWKARCLPCTNWDGHENYYEAVSVKRKGKHEN
jgi:hypothetical protein